MKSKTTPPVLPMAVYEYFENQCFECSVMEKRIELSDMQDALYNAQYNTPHVMLPMQDADYNAVMALFNGFLDVFKNKKTCTYSRFSKMFKAYLKKYELQNIRVSLHRALFQFIEFETSIKYIVTNTGLEPHEPSEYLNAVHFFNLTICLFSDKTLQLWQSEKEAINPHVFMSQWIAQ